MKTFLSKSILYIILLIFFFSCKKKTEETIVTPQPDDIFFVDISPDTTITSVREWTSFYVQSIPIPGDSGAGISLDVNHDNIDDIGFGVSHYYNFVSASNPGANYNYHSGIGMNGEKDSIAYKGTSGPCRIAEPFAKDSIISDISTYATSATTYSSGHSTVCHCNAFSGDTYFGFKLTDNGGSNFGWILVSFSSQKLTIKEFAINRTKNNPIRAGQKQ